MPHFQICSYNILSQNHIAHNLRAGIAPSHCEWTTRKQKLQAFLSSKQQDVLIIALQEVEEDFFVKRPKINSQPIRYFL